MIALRYNKSMLNKVGSFEFASYEINSDKKTISFKYRFILSEKEVIFEEKIILPNAISDKVPQKLLHKILESLHLILGISYWKMYCPEKIIFPYLMSKEQLRFWNTVYLKGLGEFFYKNNINYKKFDRLFLSNELICLEPVNLNDSKRINGKILIGIGGGKDSIVAGEKLKKEKKNVIGFILVNKGEEIKIKKDVLKILDIPYLIVGREMDEKLLKGDLNLPRVYNGHVPITAIYSFISLLLAYVEGFSSIVIPNGKSADSGNVEYLGEMINHQWSKSKEFEDLFQSYIKLYTTPGVEFGSVMRQMSDTEIFKEFIQYPKYFPYFSSCNKNFRILQKQKVKWCGQCAKCAYTFLMLAALIPKAEVITIFNSNLLEDSKLIPIYQDLLGQGKMKPFDCVGTEDEVRQALSLVIKRVSIK